MKLLIRKCYLHGKTPHKIVYPKGPSGKRWVMEVCIECCKGDPVPSRRRTR